MSRALIRREPSQAALAPLPVALRLEDGPVPVRAPRQKSVAVLDPGALTPSQRAITMIMVIMVVNSHAT
jgi:hypothetical protein